MARQCPAAAYVTGGDAIMPTRRKRRGSWSSFSATDRVQATQSSAFQDQATTSSAPTSTNTAADPSILVPAATLQKLYDEIDSLKRSLAEERAKTKKAEKVLAATVTPRQAQRARGEKRKHNSSVKTPTEDARNPPIVLNAAPRALPVFLEAGEEPGTVVHLESVYDTDLFHNREEGHVDVGLVD